MGSGPSATHNLEELGSGNHNTNMTEAQADAAIREIRGEG